MKFLATILPCRSILPLVLLLCSSWHIGYSHSLSARYADGRLLLSLPDSLLTRHFLLGARLTSSNRPHDGRKGSLSVGQRLHEPLLVRLSLSADSLHFVPKFARRKRLAWTGLPIVSRRHGLTVVDATAFFSRETAGVDPHEGKMRPARLIEDSSRIVSVRSTARNVEVSVRYAYDTPRQPLVTTIRKSLVLLPESPMPRRTYDPRVGYHQTRGALHRFRLVPVDTAAYGRGERVRPAQPIVFYVDSAFSPLWREAIKAGITDWNRAFEQIGFDRAIEVRDYADAAPDFDADDGLTHTFRYVESKFPNAMGKHWTDPRSGEIVQADVLFYGNVISLLRKWYFLQTAAYRPDARQTVLPDSTLSRLIRYAAAHEVGHCLGLEHNHRASSAYPTDSLRSRTFTAQHGTTPSIMDYARFNYVAQPEDSITAVFPPLLGEYDAYAIAVGYRYMSHEDSAEVRRWVTEAQEVAALRYGRMQPGVIAADPAVQSTDLGDDVVLSSQYGIANLRRIVAEVGSPKAAKGDAFAPFGATRRELEEAYFDYLDRVLPLVGFDSQEKTLRALDFIMSELIAGHKSVVSADNTEWLARRQVAVFDKLLHPIILQRIAAAEGRTGLTAEAYLSQLDGRLAEATAPLCLREAFERRMAELSDETAAKKYPETFVTAARQWRRQ